MGRHLEQRTVDVSTRTEFPATPDFVLDFEPDGWLILHEGTAGIIEYTFDTAPPFRVHGSCTLATPSQGMAEYCDDVELRLRVRAAVAAGTALARVGASRNR